MSVSENILNKTRNLIQSDTYWERSKNNRSLTFKYQPRNCCHPCIVLYLALYIHWCDSWDLKVTWLPLVSFYQFHIFFLQFSILHGLCSCQLPIGICFFTAANQKSERYQLISFEWWKPNQHFSHWHLNFNLECCLFSVVFRWCHSHRWSC